MADRPFVHLHCHTHYSLLDGASRVPELVQHAKGLGMNAIAMTDHGNLFGAIEFYKECKEAGLNPIVGYEAYVAPTSRTDRTMKKRGESGYHLTLLAQNLAGFKNLVKMASIAYLEGYHYIPRIDKDLLEAHSEGIICLSGCASSEFSDYILLDQLDKARETAVWFHRVFQDNFYVEIQNNGLDIQKRCAEAAVDIANDLGLPLVATSDAHYLRQDDNFAHDVLLCINTGRLLKDENRMRYGSDQFYVRPPEEMYKLFPGHEAAVKRSQEIADKCDLKLDFKKRHFPVFTPPEKKTPEAYLRELCEIGLAERYGPSASADAQARREAAQKRLEHELGVICRMGFAGYFLIVWDFVRFAISKGIPASARGSACGAVVSYVLKLSHVCPLEYDLLFERFLDPNRSEAPDIDIDFCQDQREEVIKYVRERYGENSVAQIATFGTMAAKAAIKDVGRVMDVPLERVIRLTAMVPKVLNITLEESLKESPDLKREYDSDPEIRKLIDIAMKLEGTNRNVGTHAAGVVIADGPITDFVPVQKMHRKDGGRNGESVITTQWVMGDLEKVGMLKMDFLGLRTLTVVENSLKLIRKTRLVNSKAGRNDEPDLEAIKDRDPRTYDLLKHGIDAIPLTDKKTYDLLQRGDARGVFQLESDGIRELLKRMKPDNIRDLIATNALYRPGPLGGGMVDAYVNRKNGREKATYAHPIMEEILVETHGVMCIHEDVRVSMADGTEKPIKLVRRGDRVHSLNYETNHFDVKECHGCGPTRVGAGLKIVLENGFSVTLTLDHELLTFDGLKKAEDLDPDHDLVAIAIQLEPEPGITKGIAPWLGTDVDVAYLVGLLIGDGCMTGTGPTLATGTKPQHDLLVHWLRERFPKLHLHEYFHERSWYVGISCPELLNHPDYGNRKTKFHHLLETLGLMTSAHYKHVPDRLFQCGSKVRAALLAGILDTDGCMAANDRGVGVCFLTSVSRQLLNDVRRLCQLEGIPVMVRKQRIHLWNLKRLATLLQPYLQIKQFRGKLHEGKAVGWIPRARIREAVPAGESMRSFCRRTTIERSSFRHAYPFVRSTTAAKAGIDLGQIRYMRIVGLEPVENQQFFGMSVADHHNLVANGIVVKNCYQEQIMRILNKLGGIELSSAYACIKAISKKKEDIINARRIDFMTGAQERGVSEATAKDIFDLICFFGGYGFNKSHSAAYAKLGYQTAYLKTHYPAEFMAALLSSEIDDSNKRDIMVQHIDDARRLGAEVLPPNIQDGEADFGVKNGKIVFGLLAIKGLGRGAADDIVRVRNEGGPFKDFFDFCERIDQKVVPKAAIERLVKVGAFDCTGAKRSQLWDALTRALQAASQAQVDRKHGQRGLFDSVEPEAESAGASTTEGLREIPEWIPLEKLKYEKESLDFYISSHPLGQFEETLRRFTSHNASNLKQCEPGQEVFVGGMLTQVRLMNTKKARNGNSRYARFKLEDHEGAIECVLWPDDFVKYKDLIEEDRVVFASAAVERKTDEPMLQITRVLTMEQGQVERTTGLVLLMDLTDRGDEDLRKLESVRGVLSRSRGNLPVFIYVRDGAGKWLRMRAADELRVNPTTLSKADLEVILGPGRVEFSRQGGGGR